MIPFSTSLRVPEDVLISDVGGEAVLLNLKNEKYFGLDETALQMWSALTTSASVQAAFENLLAKYEVSEEQLKHDLQRLIEQLTDNGLLEVAAEQMARLP